MSMDLTKIKGIGKAYSKKFMEAGIDNAEKLLLANEEEIAKKTGIKIDRIKKWKEEAKKIAKYAKAEILEDIPKISFIEIKDGEARVKIKDYWHDAKIYKEDFEKVKDKLAKEKVAVIFVKKPKLWFNGKIYEVPYKIKKRWWK